MNERPGSWSRNDRGAARVSAVMTTTVGFIGAGMIGGTVARLAVAAGHRVVLSNSRGPQTLKALTDELGPPARRRRPLGAADRSALPIVIGWGLEADLREDAPRLDDL